MARIMGFKYATGVSYCDLELPLIRGEYQEVAWVWENGQIDWKISQEKYSSEDLKSIYHCSFSNKTEVENKRVELDTLIKKFSSLLNMSNKETSLKELNIKRRIFRLREELEDLEIHKTTCVVHYY